jgi:hypothetical protein
MKCYELGDVPEGKLSRFVPDLCALEDRDHALTQVLWNRNCYSNGRDNEKQDDLEQRAQYQAVGTDNVAVTSLLNAT